MKATSDVGRRNDHDELLVLRKGLGVLHVGLYAFGGGGKDILKKPWASHQSAQADSTAAG